MPPRTTNDPSQPSIQITAGKIQNLSFRIDLSNRNPGIINYPQTITDIAVFVVSQSSSVKIIGPTTWSLPRLDSNSSHLISTKVYASPSTIGNPVFFTVTVQYIKNGQELKTDSFDIGAIVIGDIKIESNNLGIRYLGDTPNLVGNLLNKGNSGALFTNLQVLSVSLQREAGGPRVGTNLLTGASQFLGTLPPNTPTPFSIPISIDLVTPQSGANKINQSSSTGVGSSSNNINTSAITNSANNYDNTIINPKGLSNAVYLVSLKITYSDELTNNHIIIVNGSIPYGLIDNISETSHSNINGSFSTDQSAQAQLEQLQQVPPGIQSVLNNGFVDAYWAENIPSSSSNSSSSGTSAASTGEVQVQREVGPGEGPAILAVVLTNTAFSDITGITGYLTLPDGFSTLVPLSSAGVSYNENVKQNYPAIASISDVVKAGETYTLFFKVDILKAASVGLHTATLRTYYFKTPDPETGAYRVQTTSVPFVLAGKVVLDTTSSSTDLTPGEVNHVKIQIRNKGTANANNVVVTLNSAGGSIITSTGAPTANGSISNDVAAGKILEDDLTAPSSNQPSTSNNIMRQEASSLGSRIFNLGTIAAKSAAEIDAAILPSFSSGESLQNLNLQVSYTDATGETKSSDEVVGFRVLPNPPEAGLAVNPNAIPQGTSNPNTSTESNGANESSSNNKNDGTTSSSGLSVTPSSLASSIVPSNDYYQGVSLAHIENRSSPFNNKALIENPSYYTGNTLSSAQSSESLYKKVSISDTPNGIENDKSVITNGNNDRSDNSNSPDSITITAGKESNLNFTITNNNRYPILDAVVSLDSQSTSIAISGPSKWNLQRLAPGAHQFFSTTVFASTAIIGSPVSFEVGAQYIMNGRARNDTFNIGAKVIGEINVDVSNIAINNIAGTPNLIGNLLNKGNTVALFTTIQLLSPGNSTDQNQSLQNRHPTPTISQSSQDANSQESLGNGSSSRSSSNRSADGLVPVSTFPSYLGDLDANSPLPFSIPLALKNNSSPGSYPISLRITYSDDLRASHALIINSSVDLTRSRQRSGDNGNQNQGFLGILLGKQYSLQIGGISLPMPVILIIVAVALVLLISRRRRRSSVGRIYAASKSSSKEDKFFLDGKGNKDPGTISSHTNLENERSKGSGAEGTGEQSDMNKEVDNSGEKK